MRLIDADTLKKAFDFDDDEELEVAVIHYGIDHSPTVDAVPVIHAEWEQDEALYHCTHCRHTILCHDRMDLAEYHRYCGRCGAMMSM